MHISSASSSSPPLSLTSYNTDHRVVGHGAKRCPEPNKEEAAGDMGFDAPGGDAGFDTGADAGAATFDASGGAFDSGAGDTLDTGIAVGGGGGGW